MSNWNAWGWDEAAPHQQRGAWQGEGEPVGLPERTTFDQPPPAIEGKMICRDTETDVWVYR